MPNSEIPVNTINRDFKGIWIPREIWLADGLSPTEKILWAEIHSLYNREKGGCYASNEYLSNFMGVKERTVRDALCKLRILKLIEDVSFNGRERVIKALEPDEKFSDRLAEWRKTAMQDGENPPVKVAEKRQSHLYIEQSVGTSIETTPTSSSKKGQAKACEREKKTSPKKTVKPKREDISQEAEKLLPRFLEAIRTGRPKYILKDELSMLASIDEMLSDGREPDHIIKVMKWAVNDKTIRGTWTGWANKIMCKNPAAYLCERFEQLETASEAKEDRKFAPSSNDARSLEKVEEWFKGAL